MEFKDLKIKAKETAIKEVEKRIVTKEDAKQNFLKWIEQSSKYGAYTDEVVYFWKEVKKELVKL